MCHADVLHRTRVSNISTFLLSAFLSELQLGVLPSMVETSAFHSGLTVCHDDIMIVLHDFVMCFCPAPVEAAAAQAEKKQKTDQTVAVTKCLLLQYAAWSSWWQQIQRHGSTHAVVCTLRSMWMTFLRSELHTEPDM